MKCQACVARVSVLLAWIGVVQSACANLGQDEQTIDAAYGKRIERRIRDRDGKDIPAITKGATVSSLYDGSEYLILVIFAEGLSVFEMYARQDGRPLKPKEALSLMKVNGNGMGWTLLTDKEKTFERTDHKVFAEYREVGGRLTLVVRVVRKEVKL